MLYTENAKVSKKTYSDPIALAYKYNPEIEPLIKKAKPQTSKTFKGSDEDSDDEVKVANLTSFPANPDIVAQWYDFSKEYHKNTKPAIVMPDKQPSAGGDSADTQGNKTVDTEKTKEAAGTVSKIQNDALKSTLPKYQMKKWFFQHHHDLWASSVNPDGDIYHITKKKDKDKGDGHQNKKTGFQMEMCLAKKEWQIFRPLSAILWMLYLTHPIFLLLAELLLIKCCIPWIQ